MAIARAGVALCAVLLSFVLSSAAWAAPGGYAPSPTPATPEPRAGYHHLGATTVGGWSGVSGRLRVADPGVRPGTYDFVAARFMARSTDGTAWLEAGWSENGWLRDGRQHVYTYDTVSRRWTFHDEYPIGPGDRVWINLESAGEGHWRAWLWWQGQWRLLTDQRLPIRASTTIEQYVEVYVDPAMGGYVTLPPAGFDNVRLRDAAGRSEFWRLGRVPTGAGSGFANYCLNWVNRFDTWSAATCAAARQR
ncbi:hypothetical protein GCM10009682_43400 [Luedemannella flava]|uniref:Uncharacterized protein n=1 Tax=Luedemannella flava TaxID=349316 RepID=A0ABN2MAM7_9ACTN